MIGQRKLVLIRKESKQVSVFISKEPKQSLGLGSKLVKVIQVKVDISKVVLYLYTLFDFGFYTSCDKVALRPSGGERAPLMEIYFLLLWGQRRDKRTAVPALPISQVVLFQNNQYGIRLQQDNKANQNHSTMLFLWKVGE